MLNTMYRQILFLYYIEEKPYREIAQQLGTTEQYSIKSTYAARRIFTRNDNR
ncbi:sigma factor-like helix-turn-helix DNA-binding protein [Paenibacillus cisolokensis]|uniref:sigma factor-like helix-turn-helix DNA-binding protein n=1 Tax=Paenibacillus cisolokensis TaxID=1658519 RepID=UPI003D278436